MKNKYNNHNNNILYTNIFIEVHWYDSFCQIAQPPSTTKSNTFHNLHMLFIIQKQAGSLFISILNNNKIFRECIYIWNGFTSLKMPFIMLPMVFHCLPVMPRTSGADLWADPSKQHETQRGMVARGRLMPKNKNKQLLYRKTKTDESQVAVLEIASRGSWEGCRLCWGPGCAAGRDEIGADERGRRTAEGIAGWKLETGESRGLGNEGSQELGGHWESREEMWNEMRRKENDQKNI